MASQVAVANVVCNLILAVTLAACWAHSAPLPTQQYSYGSPQSVAGPAALQQSNVAGADATGQQLQQWRQFPSPAAGQAPLVQQPAPEPVPPQPLMVATDPSSQADRFKRQSVGNASLVSASNGGDQINKKKKKNKKNKNSKKNKNKRRLAECLESHNKFRRQHRVPNLEWDDKLAEFAQKRSNHIAASDGAAFGHPPDLPFGENLFWHSSVDTPCEHMIRGWYDEINLYNYRSPTFAPETGHFTQLIWRTTTKVGCAFATSSGKKGGIYLTCNYDPPGNFIGEFNENVPLPVAAESTTNDKVPPTQVDSVKPLPVPAAPSTTTTTTTTTERSVTIATAAPTTSTSTTAAAVVPVVGGGSTSVKPADTPTSEKPKKKNKKKKDKNKKNKDKKKNKKRKKKKSTTTTTTTTTTIAPPLPVRPTTSANGTRS